MKSTTSNNGKAVKATDKKPNKNADEMKSAKKAPKKSKFEEEFELEEDLDFDDLDFYDDEDDF